MTPSTRRSTRRGARRSTGRASPALPATGNHEYTDPDPAPPGCRLVDGAQHACGFERYFGEAPFTGTVADGHGSYARLFGRGTRHPLAVIVLDVGSM